MNMYEQLLDTKVSKKVLSWNLRKVTSRMLIVSVIIGLITSMFWYNRVFLDEERRFWNAINTSLSTPSVTRTLTQGGSGNQVTQNYRFHFAPQQVIENTVDFVTKSATEDLTVRTEGRVYPQEQYLRYTEFTNVDSTGDAINDIDDLLGDWAFQEGQGPNVPPEDNNLVFLSEYVSIVPFGNYDANYRAEVIKTMRDNDIYSLDVAQARTEMLENDEGETEEIIVYPVTVKLKEFAGVIYNAFLDAGYGEFPSLDPEGYEEGQTLNGVITVSKANGTIGAVEFGGRTEIYSNYGVIKSIEKPEYSQTVQELQTAVQQAVEGTTPEEQ